MNIYVFGVLKTLFKILCCKKCSVFKTMKRKLMELNKVSEVYYTLGKNTEISRIECVGA